MITQEFCNYWQRIKAVAKQALEASADICPLDEAISTSLTSLLNDHPELIFNERPSCKISMSVDVYDDTIEEWGTFEDVDWPEALKEATQAMMHSDVVIAYNLWDAGADVQRRLCGVEIDMAAWCMLMSPYVESVAVVREDIGRGVRYAIRMTTTGGHEMMFERVEKED